MAAFKSYTKAGVGATPVAIFTATVKSIVIGLSASNTYGATVPLTVSLDKATGDTAVIVSRRRVELGAFTDFMAGNKLVLEVGDVLYAVSDVTGAYDTVVSVLEGVA